MDVKWISKGETDVTLLFLQGETPSLESIRRLIQEELAKELQGKTDGVKSDRYKHILKPDLLYRSKFIV